MTALSDLLHSVWAQTGCYILIVFFEIFTSIISPEYAFSKAARSMRSLVQAVTLFTNAVSAAIAEALNLLSAYPLLVRNYGVVAVASLLGVCRFMWQFWSLEKEEDALNLLLEGQVVAVKDVEDASDANVHYISIEEM